MALACLDGRIVDTAEARVPVTDAGLLRGDGVFEVVRLYGGRPFALEDHLARLERSAAGLLLPVDVEAVRSDVDLLLAAARPGDACLRVLVTGGGRRIALIEALPDRPAAARLALVTYAPPRLLDQVKSLSYAANMLATRLARRRGFDDALLVTPHGRLLEAPTGSFFYVLDGRLWTPPLEDHVLDSITRRRLLEVADAGERSLAADDLGAVEEAFVASTTREVEAVAAIEDHRLPAPGAVTRSAHGALCERIADELRAAAP